MVLLRNVSAVAASFLAGGLLSDKLQRMCKEPFAQDLHAALPPENSRPNEIMKFGFPTASGTIVKPNYVLGYDTRLRNARWVFEHLNRDLVQTSKSDRMECKFTEDNSIHRFFRSTNEDFFRSGYDRGHLAAAANHRASQRWMEDTFLLSNIVPQHPFMNQQAWNNLEKYVRSLAFHYDNVYVCTGPLYLPQLEPDGKSYVRYEVLGRNRVAVPTHLFKVVVCQRKSKFELLSYVMPNEWVDPRTPLDQFLAPVEAIERDSGLIIFGGLSRDRFHKINHGRETAL